MRRRSAGSLKKALISGRICPKRWGPSITDDDLIAKAVRNSGLTKGRDEDVAAFVEAHRGGGLDQRRASKTPQLIATLNDRGLKDSREAIWIICSYAKCLIYTARNLQRARESSIEFVRFRASNMVAGPCLLAASLDQRTFPIAGVDLVPFDDCPHPGQCGCLYQSVVPWLEDIE